MPNSGSAGRVRRRSVSATGSRSWWPGPGTPNERTHVARITLVGEAAGEVESRDDETVLAALHRAGHAVRSGCRRGGCGICKVDLVEGDVAYTHPVAPSVLSDAERADGACLSCRAVPEGDVAVRLREHDRGKHNGLFALYASLGITPPS